jgi:hypothetical protein
MRYGVTTMEGECIIKIKQVVMAVLPMEMREEFLMPVKEMELATFLGVTRRQVTGK